MHKISNFTGQARHGWERMTPAFGMSRPHTDMTAQSLRRPHGAPPMTPPTGVDPTVNLSFNVPFSSSLAGPDVEDVIHASPGALQRWTFPEGTPEGTPIHQLPVHASNVDALRRLCRQISESSGGRLEATVTSSEPKSVPTLQRRPCGLVTNVCITGDRDTVYKMRAKVLNETPISLRCATVDVDMHLIMDASTKGIRTSVLEHLDTLAAYTGADIFLLSPKLLDADSAIVSSYGYTTDSGLENRFRVAIYGDMESSEHAKTRLLIMIDQILKRHVDAMKLELTMHTLVCGRTRKNIKLIEAATNTAIYFPPPFPRIFGYTPPGANRRSEDEVYITGETQDNIARAKQKLRELVMGVKIYVKDVMVSSSKIDQILLDRLDKVRKVMEMNGSYVLFPQLGSQRGLVRIQGTEVLHVERTVREIMALAGQFYSASWWIIMPDPAHGGMRPPSPADVRIMLSDICTNSGADVSFDNLTFTINGSDDAVKAAMMVIHQIPFVKRSPYQMRVKIELANEHKEFVSGKKNGKINKIMGQSNVQIIFDGFNEYNFYIDVCGTQYEATKNGLDLVEQEMPASISFHVPDQYHKRIIGIGGQHIQRIMKKYSVFVKFSNAMDRGGVGKEDDDIKVDNVICRTPARNAQSLDLVKQEIMDMVEKVDAEYVSETVVINRLYHRELLARMSEIEELEKKWNCKIDFPSTELASDIVTISGPEYQVPQAVDAFLGMVPESHELSFQSSAELRQFFKSAEFVSDVRGKLKSQYEVDVAVDTSGDLPASEEEGVSPTSIPEDRLVLGYTRNNAGGLKDAIDFLISRLVPHGLDATTVKGAIPRPKSDSFEESLPFFDSKLLQHAPAPLVTDSPTRPSFADDVSERGSIFERLRKPGSISSFSSFIGRKNHSGSPGSFFKHASSNASKASLVSMESRDSGYRNPWNDSGVNLPEEDIHHVGSSHSHSGSNGWPARFDTKFPFGTAPGDITPKHDPRASFDSGRPSTSNSTSGYPAPIGPPR
ncbi:KH domain protein [Paecilomyces variotii No. 5]|uniref:KH domain protein n=1 Tax=Byssochlamys spectabilis (strain No. 5 / NBRC 109023) TaxID=1356009 RepID=V5FUZ8_BYSSN|nr:KH domain protein [Paecilomyces variotii No. 5]